MLLVQLPAKAQGRQQVMTQGLRLLSCGRPGWSWLMASSWLPWEVNQRMRNSLLVELISPKGSLKTQSEENRHPSLKVGLSLAYNLILEEIQMVSSIWDGIHHHH